LVQLHSTHRDDAGDTIHVAEVGAMNAAAEVGEDEDEVVVVEEAVEEAVEEVEAKTVARSKQLIRPKRRISS
jgi:hypothetical protein